MKCGERVRVRVRTRARERLSLLSRRAEVTVHLGTVHYCVQRVAELVKVNRSIIPWKVLLVAACTALQSFPIPTLTPNSHHFRFTTGRNASFPDFPKRPPSRWDHS